jgi:hypothetical protein
LDTSRRHLQDIDGSEVVSLLVDTGGSLVFTPKHQEDMKLYEGREETEVMPSKWE